MIWQLVQRDFSWRWAVSALILAALAGFFAGGDTAGFIVIVVQFFLIFGASRPTERATPFHATLPVLARDVVLARLYGALSAIWVPTSASIFASIIAHRLPALGACMAVEAFGLSFVTCLTLLLRPRTLEAGTLLSGISGLLVLLFTLPAFVLYTSGFPSYESHLWQRTYGIVLAVYFATIILVALCVFRTRFIPPSFQYAPLRSKRVWPQLRIRRSIRSRHPWNSLFKTVFISPSSIFWWLVGAQVFTWTFWITPIIGGAMVATTLKRGAWLLTLPIRRARILAFILGAGLMVVLPWVIVIPAVFVPELRTLAVERTCTISLLYLALANVVLLWWNCWARRRLRLLENFVGISLCAGPVMFVVVRKLNSSTLRLDPQTILQEVTALLSSHPAIVAVSSTTLLVLLWRSAQRLFAVAELHNPVVFEGKFAEIWDEA